MKKTARSPSVPVMEATKGLIEKLWKDYILLEKDIVRANQVHLVSLAMISKDPLGMTQIYQFYIRSAIEWLTIDQNIIHSDPYELRIDAWYFDKNLKEIEDIKKEESGTVRLKDKFVCSAIIWKDDKMYVWVRHAHCMRHMACLWIHHKWNEYQWFMLADGRFINRKDWLILAKQTGQLNDERIHWELLYSENLR